MKEKITSIQALRAIAATAVVWHHMAWQIKANAPHPYIPVPEKWFGLGASGVDIFFVISGFVIFFISPFQGVPLADRLTFLKKRAVRIYPLYFVLTIVSGLFFIMRASRGKLTAKYVICSLFLIPVKSPLNGNFHPLLDQGWTLLYEAGFYLLFSILLGLALRTRLFGIAAALGGLFGLAYLCTQPVALIIWRDPIIFEFVLGGVLAYLYRRELLPTGKIALAFMLLGFALLFASAELPPGMNRLLIWGLPAVLIVGGAIGFEASPVNQGAWFAWLVPLGDASYSLYLCHSLVTLVLGSLAKGGRLGAGGAEHMVAIFAGIAVSIVLAFLIHWGVELPLMRLFKPRIRPDANIYGEAATA